MKQVIADAWNVLRSCDKSHSIAELSAANPDRAHRFSVSAGPLYLNYARQAFDDDGRRALFALAERAEVIAGIRSQMAGEAINVSEGREVLHTALRAPAGAEPQSQVEAAQAARERLVTLVDSVLEGRRRGHTGKRFQNVLSIGIGGSDLGPRLACDVLPKTGLPVRFLSNIDGDAVADAIAGLDAESTLVVVISKSFGTQETLTNALSVRGWLTGAMGCTEQEAGAHMIAVTARVDRAQEMGIDPDAILPMWDWVGGRYSLWSTVGLPIALSSGNAAFAELLSGARVIDEHAASADVDQNLPVLMALIAIWNRNVLELPTHAVVPYSDRLAKLPNYLQQLAMESNGKNALRDGEPVSIATAPVIWGGAGTDAQHAFFQMLHQGTDRVPVDFVGFRRSDSGYDQHHRLLLANLFAQSEALAVGRGREATSRALSESGLSEAEAEAASAHRIYPGNRPNSVFLLDDLSPHSLGALLAAWEHSVFVQGWILGINSFDQWGVELGKQLADRIAPLVEGSSKGAGDHVTDALVAKIS